MDSPQNRSVYAARRKQQVFKDIAELLYGELSGQLLQIVISPEDPYGHHWSVECRYWKPIAFYLCPTCITRFELLRSDLLNKVPLCGYCGTPLLEEDYGIAN